jgi:hypothetical protein
VDRITPVKAGELHLSFFGPLLGKRMMTGMVGIAEGRKAWVIPTGNASWTGISWLVPP